MSQLKTFLILLVLISCTNTKTEKWTIPIHDSQKKLEIELPVELNNYKTSIHLSDCSPCAMQQSIFSEKRFADNIPDTTGFFSPWLVDSTAKWFLYFNVQLNKELTSPFKTPDLKSHLKEISISIYQENSNFKIVSEELKNNLAIIKYEVYNSSGTIISKRIEGLAFLDSTRIKIHFVQNQELNNDMIESVWAGLQNLKTK